MQYKGKELKEANGAEYPFGNTPKKMIVWNEGEHKPREREILGYCNGRWIALMIPRYGVDCFECAAEIPEEPKKRWCGVEEDA